MRISADHQKRLGGCLSAAANSRISSYEWLSVGKECQITSPDMQITILVITTKEQ